MTKMSRNRKKEGEIREKEGSMQGWKNWEKKKKEGRGRLENQQRQLLGVL